MEGKTDEFLIPKQRSFGERGTASQPCAELGNNFNAEQADRHGGLTQRFLIPEERARAV